MIVTATLDERYVEVSATADMGRPRQQPGGQRADTQMAQ